MKRILLFLSMLLLVGGTTMASLNGAYPNYLAHLSNNESSTPTHHIRGAEQRNGNNAGSSALNVVALKKDNVNAQTLEQEGNKDQITFRTDKSVGEEIYLEISYPLGSNIESITVEGATLTKSEDFPNLLKSNRTYKLTSQEVRIIGEVSDFICANNKITSLDLSKCPNLKTLKCSNNLLESLHVDNCTNLSILECNDNKIDYLDLSNAKNLQFLYCYKNLIENLIFSNDTRISTLECYNNKIEELDLSHATKLYSLDCSHNKITTLKTSLERITEIDCSFNEIKELNISAAYHLNRFNCDFNKLNKLSIDNCPLLSVLFFKYNNISELSVQYNPKLIYVDAIESTTNMSLIEQLVASLPTVGDASNKQGDFRLISSLDIFNDFIEKYGKNVLKTLTKNLNNKGWKSADAHGTEIIASPYISFTTNKSVGETINVQLKMLPDANVEDIQLEGATLVSSTLKRDSERFSEYYFQTYKLTSNTVKISGDILELLCPNNELTSIDISNHELSILEFPDNHITTLDTKKACNLMRLDCSRNNLTTLDVFANWALRVLICTENNISTLALRDYGRLNYLFCSNNKLNELNLSDMYALRAVYCNDNQITKLTITDNPILGRIDCYRNNITEINIANNPNLMNLDIHKNKITLEQMEQLANDLPVESDPSNYERILTLKDIVGEENKYSTEIINKILSKGWKVEDTNNVSLGISAIENDENQPRKVFDLNGREVNENQVKGVVIIKQGNKTYKKVVK
jgi:internalin-J